MFNCNTKLYCRLEGSKCIVRDEGCIAGGSVLQENCVAIQFDGS